ncbi:MAG: HDOD domain-containing protein [bacterium]|nr:HDOD domain-containing protein [bacterium]
MFKLVNSAGYGFQKKVDSLKLAVTLIGLEEIANLVMTAQVFQKLGDYAGGAGLDLEGFWKHSVGTAFVARSPEKTTGLRA